MPIRFIAVVIALTTSLVPANDFQAGAARSDITPPVGLPMWGYGDRHDKPSEGVLDALYADAVVLSAGGKRLAVVGLDLGRAPTRKSFEAIRRRILEEAKVEQIFLVGSHTHHGPVLEIGDFSPATAAYCRTLEDKIVSVVRSAADRLAPARLATARTTVDFNRNRHSKLANPPVDRDLLVLRLVDAKDQTIATLVNFAAHPTSLPSKLMKYSADYPGSLKETVRNELGGECIFLQGACGDLSTDRRGQDHRAYGANIGKKAIEIIRAVAANPVAKPAIATREERFRFEPLRMSLGSPLVRAVYAKWMFRDLVEAYAKEYEGGAKPILTAALVNNEIGIVGVSGEFFANHAIRLKERSRLQTLLFLGYCNDYQQYFPTIEGAAEGGYGADMQVSPVPIGAGEIMMNRALTMLYEMRGKYRSPLRIVD